MGFLPKLELSQQWFPTKGARPPFGKERFETTDLKDNMYVGTLSKPKKKKIFLDGI